MFHKRHLISLLCCTLSISFCNQATNIEEEPLDAETDETPTRTPATAKKSNASNSSNSTTSGDTSSSGSSSSKENKESSSDNVLAKYDANLGEKLASTARSRAGGSSMGRCFEYVAGALEDERLWPRGFYDSGDCQSTDLNCRSYAKSFALHWKTSVHQEQIPFQPVFLKNNKNGENVKTSIDHTSKAPVGSILVWDPCSSISSAAGHIAIVTKKGQEAASDFIHPTDVCNEANLVGIFIPIKK